MAPVLGRAATAAISQVHAIAMRVRLAQRLDDADVVQLIAAKNDLGDDHVVGQAVVYFLLVCAQDSGAVVSHALRLRDVVLAFLNPAPHKDLGQIYG